VAGSAGNEAPPYAILLSHAANGEGPAWRATVEQLPGCEASGETPERAVAQVGEAVERWVGAAKAEGREVPPPRTAPSYSGRLLVRMPRTLHAELSRAADREGTSLNAYIIGALSASISWRRPDAAAKAAAQPPRPEGAGSPPRALSLALKANLIVLAIAAALALALLVSAWRG
jgi:predicted HicB family RNase H-like nuclease